MKPSTILAKLRKHPLVTGIVAAGFWIVVWQILSMIVAQELLLPAPLVVLKTWFSLASKASFWQAAGLSLVRVAVGFLAAVITGSLLAVLTVRFRIARVLLSPVIYIVRAAPVVSFIILAMVWIKTPVLPIFIAFLMVVPVIWSNVEKGIRETDTRLLEMAAVYKLGFWKTLIRIRIPSVMPYFMAACTTGLGFAWKSGVAAEVICNPPFSIGRQLQEAKRYLETPEVFALTATVVLLSILLEKLLLLAAARWGKRWNTGEEADAGS